MDFKRKFSFTLCEFMCLKISEFFDVMYCSYKAYWKSVRCGFSEVLIGHPYIKDMLDKEYGAVLQKTDQMREEKKRDMRGGLGEERI